MAILLEPLRRPEDFEALQREGTSRAHPLLVIRAMRNGLGRTRVGYSTGRRLGGAVVRNRVRRRLRAIFRALAPRLEPGWDILVVARPSSVEATYAELAVALERLVRRAGILADEVTVA
jgi:ribonuclease P protein component